MATSICNDILSVLFLELQGRVYKNVQNSGSLIKKKNNVYKLFMVDLKQSCLSITVINWVRNPVFWPVGGAP